LVIDAKHRPTKTQGRFFLQLTLRTMQGDIKGMMWDAPPQGCEENLAFPQLADIIAIHDFKDELAQYGSIKITAGGFVRTSLEDLPDDVKQIAEPPKATEEELAEAKGILFDEDLWEDPVHFEFIKNCLVKLDREKLMQSPAATNVHHAYQGGLLVHTSEVLDLCKVIAAHSKKRYGFVNTDVLYASAILHDIGKVDTYRINELGLAASVHQEKSIGHMFYGMHLVKSVGEEMEGISEKFIDEILHCIASHHGLLEWGSYKTVQSIEAGILSRADYISSRNGMMEKKLGEYIDNHQAVEDEFKIYGDLYFGSLGLSKYVQDRLN